MNRKMRRTIAIGAVGKHTGKKQTEINSDIFREIFLRQLAQQTRNREQKTTPVRAGAGGKAENPNGQD